MYSCTLSSLLVLEASSSQLPSFRCRCRPFVRALPDPTFRFTAREGPSGYCHDCHDCMRPSEGACYSKRAHIQGAPPEGTAPALKIVAPEPRWGIRCVGRDRGAAPGCKAYGITTVRRRQHSQFWRSIQWQTAHRCDLDCSVIGWAVRAAEQDPRRSQGVAEAHPTALRPSTGCQPWCAAPVRCQCSVCVGMGARGECGVGFKG